MNILAPISDAIYTQTLRAYRVVKFIVIVKLVEKSLKSHVGRVMENHVIIQNRILGIALNKKKKMKTVSECSQPLEDSPLVIAGTLADAWANIAELLLLAIAATERVNL